MRKYLTGQVLACPVFYFWARFFAFYCRAVNASFLGETNAWSGKAYRRFNL
jgi:hypothetical protein